ncbi:glycine reductase [Pseudothauera rhizosphaerae]|uniref:Glycine reductase n=2 Tax=Pseudothauera rhizosphaerae TaxID=2565932 RepID=A0A4S4B3B9_9RHOO|nr:glycine reductase [Pseudothauera rhizosphaerae]
MARTRAWYLALGYDNPYVWAHYADVPFAPLKKPLAKSRVAIVTTAAPFQPGKGEQGPGAPYNAAVKFYRVYTGDTARDHDLRIAHVGIDRKHADLADSGCWFPLPALRRAVAAGRVGELAPRFFGAPTNRSQRHTLEVDAPEIVAGCLVDGVDAVLLVPNCPICHQTLSLVARRLEAAGIATVVLGAAKDIVEHAGVPRLLFSDFPLGNAAGKPRDAASQAQTLELALRLLESAPAPRTTVQSPQRWSAGSDWKLDYANPGRLSAEELARRRAEAEAVRVEARALRVATLGSDPEEALPRHKQGNPA